MSSVLRSLRLAARSLRRSPSFTLVAVLTFALGIGATTSIFSVVDAVLLDPLPYPDSERLAAVYSRWQDEAQGRISPAEYFDYAERLESASAFGVWGIGSLTLTGSGEAQQIAAGYLSHGALPAFGVRPLHGRFFTAAEDEPGAAPVALLSYGLWQRRFGGRADAIGSSIVADGTAVTIIGVMPRSFRLPEDFEAGETAGLYLPLQLERPAPDDRGSHFLEGIARLAPGETVETLSADAARVAAEFVREFPDEYPREMGFTAFAMPLRESILGAVRPLVLLVFGAAALVLLIASVNVANLVVVRGDRRQRELAVRAAIGAERRHLLHQFLAETFLLALAGGVLGMAIAAAATRLLPRILPAEVPIPGDLTIDVRVTAFAFAVVVATAIVTALVPVFRRRGDLTGALRDEGRGNTGGAARAGFRGVLTIVQVALAVALSLGAGLLLRTMAALENVDPGFRTEGVLTFRLALPSSGYDDDAERVAFFRRLEDRLASLPGIASAGAVTNLPLATSLGDLNFEVEGRPVAEDEAGPRADWQAVTPGYLDAVGMRIVRGRGITAADDENAPGVIVLNEATAGKYWPGGDAIGQRLLLGGGAGPGWVTVVGIAADIRHAALGEEPREEMYIPHAQFRFWHGGGAASAMSVAVRADGSPAALAARVREVVRSIDPNIPVTQMRTLDEVRASSIAQPRFVTILFGAFAAVAVALATIGVYGMLSFLVAQRRRDIGVRMALGAPRGRILRGVVGEGLRVTIPGLLAGLAIGFAGSRVLEALLSGVEPIDPLTFVAAPAVLCAVALAASLVPAFRASRVDAMIVLRSD